MEATFVDPVTFSFLNPITKRKKYLYIHIDHRLSFYDKIGKVTELALKKLSSEINLIHEQLTMNDLAEKGFVIGSSKECDPEWIATHLIKCLPTRQGNGVVWERPLPKQT